MSKVISFKDLIVEKILNEKSEDASIDTITNHVLNRNVGAISAEKDEFSPETNAKRTQELRKDLVTRGLSHIPVKGRYIENYGTPKAVVKDGENSFFVHSHKDLLPYLKELGAKYNQDSVLHKSRDDSTAKLVGTNNAEWPGKDQEVDAGKYVPNYKGEFHSRLKNGQAFSFTHNAS